MSKNTTYSGQSFLNKVLECTGDLENSFSMALLNNVSITDNLVIGSKVNESEITNKYITDFFTIDRKPATGIIVTQDVSELTGIDYWAIGTDFIIQ